MASVSIFKPHILSLINSANNVLDLVNLLKSIPVHAIKVFANQQIELFNAKSLRTAYYNSLSTDHIFPDDITQYILSFGGFTHTKAVSKKWQIYANQNQKKYLNKMYKSIHPRQLLYNPGTTLIVDEHRTVLHEVEAELGYIGPVHDLQTAFKLCKLRKINRMFLHNGCYAIKFDHQYDLHNNDNIQLIGIGHDVKFYMNAQLMISNKLYIENINIIVSGFDDLETGAFPLWMGSTLRMKNCIMQTPLSEASEYSLHVLVRKDSEFSASDCTFIGSQIAIEITPFAKNVNVSNCVFKNCGQATKRLDTEPFGCIMIFDDYADVDLHREIDEKEWVSLTCIGSVFEDNYCYPIVEKSHKDYGRGHYLFNSDKCILKDNILKGYNGNTAKQCLNIDTANKLYHCHTDDLI